MNTQSPARYMRRHPGKPVPGLLLVGTGGGALCEPYQLKARSRAAQDSQRPSVKLDGRSLHGNLSQIMQDEAGQSLILVALSRSIPKESCR